MVLNLGGWIRFQNLGPSRPLPLLLPGPGMIEGVFEIFINYYCTMIQNSKFILCGFYSVFVSFDFFEILAQYLILRPNLSTWVKLAF